MADIDKGIFNYVRFKDVDSNSGLNPYIFLDESDGDLKFKDALGNIFSLTGGIGSVSFISLADTPSNYTGAENRLLKVNETPDEIEFASYLYGDDSALRLGINTTSPESSLHIGSTIPTGIIEPGNGIVPYPISLYAFSENNFNPFLAVTIGVVTKTTIDSIGLSNIGIYSYGFVDLSNGDTSGTMYNCLNRIDVIGDGNTTALLNNASEIVIDNSDVASTNGICYGYASTISNTGDGTIDTAIGFNTIVNQSGSAVINNVYGFVESVSGTIADSIYAFYNTTETAYNYFAGKVKIGQSYILSNQTATCAKLEVDSDNSGLLFPRMSTGQRDAIPSPLGGLVIYNIDTNVLNFYNGSVWGAI